VLTLAGTKGNLSLFSDGERGVVIDTDLNIVQAVDAHENLSSAEKWEVSQLDASDDAIALANAAVGYFKGPLTAGGERKSRLYTIPGSVQREAKKALEWRKEHGRGGTPVGMNTARTLAKGGQIGIQKVRHIAKYFPRHEVDKKGKGWDRGEDGYPSNGKIAWALWGGDPAWSWARTIVEREDRKAKTASAYDENIDELTTSEYSTYSSDLESFRMAHELDPNVGPEFMARVRMDNSGIDRLYKIDIDGSVFLWDGDGWDNMGHVDGDIYFYDKELDEFGDMVEKTHVMIDPESAVILSAFMQERPYQPVKLEEIDPEEAELVAYGLSEEDYGMIDRVLTAAGDSPTNRDGNYTPEERSKIASKQPRDAGGKFVTVGARTVVAGDTERGSGEITKIDVASGKVEVRLDSGKTISVDAKYTQAEADVDAPTPMLQRQAPIDFSGILGEPRTPRNMPLAHLPGTLPPLTSKDINSLLKDFPSYVSKMRNSYKTYDDNPKGLKDYDKKFVKERHGINAAGEKAEEAINSPKESDVPAKYLAIVSPEDMTAVMDLVALVPASKTSTEPVVYERVEGKWQKNDQILLDLKSATPPPVVQLDDKEVLNDVLKQADETAVQASGYDFAQFWEGVVEPLLAKGGLDRNRGGAEKLRRYWTRGKGALKIRWGTPGDWTRCVRYLSKYMGPRAKGYCQLRHKEVTGVYTGDPRNPGRKKGRGRVGSSMMFTSEESFDSIIVEKSRLAALAADARQKVGLVAAATEEKGASFFIPMLVPEEQESGDGRKFKEGAISMRDLPVPLLWQIKTGSGHDGSVVVGRIDYIERVEGGLGNAYGVFDTGPYGKEAERLVRHGFLRGVSVDLDQFEAKEDKPEKAEENADDGEVMGKDKLTITKARIMAATIVAKPAFQECSIELQNEGDQEEAVTPEDGVYEESMEDFADLEPLAASGFLKQEVPMIPPADWFKHPGFTKPTPLTIDDDGRIYGHIAAWNVSHIGLPRATKPPRSRSKYAYFHTGVLRTDDGNDVPVGQLTLAGGHAPLNADAKSAAKHYDDTASAVADIHVGEDEYGIWCAGSIRPALDEMQIRALRASAPSGDWRPIQGGLELVAICQVNVPGFPTARAMIASGKVMALVAAGASYMAAMKCSGPACALNTKAELLGELAASAPNLRGRVREAKKALREANLEALTASATGMREKALVAAAVAELAKISQEERMKLAKKGHALDDGAYPIRNVEDLKNAIQAYGRAKASERRMVRKHIMKRARQLGKWALVPEHWKNASSVEAAEQVASMRAAITAAANKDCGCNLTAAGDKDEDISDADLDELKEAKKEADKQTEEEIKAAEEVKKNKGKPVERDEDGRPKYVSGVNQPRDAKGKYRTVLARLKQDLGVAGLAKALKKAEDAENLDFAGDYAASAAASSQLLEMIDRLDAKALNPEALENVRLTAAELGKTISNLPLPFGEDAEKIKFSDLPAGLKDLIDGMISRVEAKIGKEDADIATQSLRSYMSGADLYSQGEVQSEMSKLLRLLT
jgi:hypothetical protein